MEAVVFKLAVCATVKKCSSRADYGNFLQRDTELRPRERHQSPVSNLDLTVRDLLLTTVCRHFFLAVTISATSACGRTNDEWRKYFGRGSSQLRCLSDRVGVFLR